MLFLMENNYQFFYLFCKLNNFIKIFKCFDIQEPTDPHREIDGEADTHNFEEQGSSNPSDGDTDALKAKYLLHLNVIIIR